MLENISIKIMNHFWYLSWEQIHIEKVLSVTTVQGEKNIKFKNSKFLQLTRKNIYWILICRRFITDLSVTSFQLPFELIALLSAPD